MICQPETHQKQPLRTFHAVLLENHVELSSILYVSELIYAAKEAEDDASTPETK